MKIDILVVGSLQENCYIVTIGDNSFIVDPGDEAERIINACKDKNINLFYLFYILKYFFP